MSVREGEPEKQAVGSPHPLSDNEIVARLRQVRGVIAKTIMPGSYYGFRMMVAHGTDKYLVMTCVDRLPSPRGIGGGRITKLWVFAGDRPNRVNHVYAYDQKLELAPANPAAECIVRELTRVLTAGDELPESERRGDGRR